MTDTISGTYPVTVYDLAGSSAEASFTVWRDATPPPAPTDPLINGGDAWDADGTVTLTWGQVSDGGSGLEGYYAALGDEAPTVRADSVLSDTETWAGADTPAAPYYVRARDNVGNWGVVTSDTIGIDTLPPVGSVHSIYEASAYAHASGDTAYYNSAGSGSFTARVAAEDTGSGLDQATYPETTSPGGVYGTALGGDYQYQHTYTFDGADTASGTYTVTLQDGIGRQSGVGFGVIHDTTPPTLSLNATVQGDVHVTWNVEDSDPSTSSGQGSGVDASTCLLEVREDEGAWQTFSTECGGDDTHDGQPGHTYTFRLSASDNVSNAASLEVQAVFPYVTKYYYANGQRVAMRQEGVVYYIHTDHLGSTSLTTDQNQQAVARQLYHPYGTPRWSQGTLPTDYTFTGQRDEAGLSLMHYGARFYSPRLGRFVSADSIVPSSGDPQALNRYSYVLGNPMIYVDPSGHQGEEDSWLRALRRPEGWSWGDVALTLLTFDMLAMQDWDLGQPRGTTARWAQEQFGEVQAWQRSNIREPVEARFPAVRTINEVVESPEFQMGLMAAMMTANAPLGEGYVRAVSEDWVGQSRAFKTYKGEDGLSVFEDVLPEEVLAELPGLPGEGPNTTVTIPKEGFPPGTQVIPTEAPGLSKHLSEAHRILVRPEGWSVNRFAKAIKALVGWE